MKSKYVAVFAFLIFALAGRLPIADAEELPGLRKLMDVPLRDTSLCRGPDAIWYLTGTSEPFWGFNNENGIRVWKSKDLAAWEPLGTVWRYGASPWHKPYLEKKKPLWAPEIHYLKGTFWLTYSIPGWDGTGKNSGCGLLKSTTGKPEGPYEDVQPNERLGDEIDASLFQDDDGSVYFLWHGGKIAKMKADMSGLAEPYHWLKTTVADPNSKHHSNLCAGIFGRDSFDHVGFEGMFVFKANGLYHLCCAEQFDGRYSCMIATSKHLLGPYGARYEAIPHGGHNMFLKDESGQWWSSYFGSDKTAPWRERPGILPIEFTPDDRVRPKADGVPHAQNLIAFDAEDGKYQFTIDAAVAPDLMEWSEKELKPVVREWYPKIVAMLPSEGFHAPTKIALRYRDDMGGTPASAADANVNLNAKWFRGELKREARGAVVHELVHVVQSYGGHRKRNASPTPGWIVEGIADYIRWFLYEPESRGAEITKRNLAQARYDASYRVTGNFLNWVVQHKDKELIRKLNTAAREGRYSEQLWKEWTGKSVAELGEEWKQFNEQRLK